MCYTTSVEKEMKDLETHFNRMFKKNRLYTPMQYNLGFEHHFSPIISNDDMAYISMAQWGLVPAWAKNLDFQKNTLNAKIETLNEKPSFKNYINNRCLIIADGFYEWQWLDEKGKKKQKYFITRTDKDIFAFAGIFSDYIDKQTGEIFRTYSIVTTEANDLMATIHNTKKRMPIILPPELEDNWLNKEDIQKFTQIPIDLVASVI